MDLLRMLVMSLTVTQLLAGDTNNSTLLCYNNTILDFQLSQPMRTLLTECLAFRHNCNQINQTYYCTFLVDKNMTCDANTTIGSVCQGVMTHNYTQCSGMNISLWLSPVQLTADQMFNESEAIQCPASPTTTVKSTITITSVILTSPDSNSGHDKDDPTGIVLGVVLSVLFVAVLVALLIFLHRKYNLKEILRNRFGHKKPKQPAKLDSQTAYCPTYNSLQIPEYDLNNKSYADFRNESPTTSDSNTRAPSPCLRVNSINDQTQRLSETYESPDSVVDNLYENNEANQPQFHQDCPEEGNTYEQVDNRKTNVYTNELNGQENVYINQN